MPVIPAPDSLPRLDVRPLPPEGPATVPSPKIGLAVRLRGHLRHLSPSGIRNNLASAAGMEIDRGVAFLLVPVFLACGVIFYFSLAREPDFSQPIAVVVLTALCAAGSRSWRKTHLCSWLRCCARSACSPPRLRLARGNGRSREGLVESRVMIVLSERGRCRFEQLGRHGEGFRDRGQGAGEMHRHCLLGLIECRSALSTDAPDAWTPHPFPDS